MTGSTRVLCLLASVIVVAAGCLFPSLDSLGTSDASGDAITLPDASDAAVPFCESVDASFCEDFDEPNATLFPHWDSVETYDGGSLAIVDSGLSPPNALEITYASSAQTTQLAEELTHQFSQPASHAHLVYDLIVDHYDTSGSRIEIGEIDFVVSGNLFSVRQEIVATGLQCSTSIYPSDGGATFPVVSSAVFIDDNAWHHVDVVVDLTRTPATIAFTLDGHVHADDAGVAGATFGPATPSLVGGVYYATAPTMGWQLRTDNMALWLE